MTLFLTTRGVLLYQMKDQLEEAGINTGIIGDGQLKVVRGANMGMVQTLIQALKEVTLDQEIRSVVKSIHASKKKDETLSREEIVKIAQVQFEKKTRKREAIKKFLSMVEVVIGEEAHEAGGSSYYEILKHCTKATIRVALTATPFMRSSAEDNMRLMAAFGPVLIDVSEKLLIDRGILAKPYFKFKDIEPSTMLRKSSPFERAYKLGFTENPHMHREIVSDCKAAAARKLPALLLVSRKAHGETLLDSLRRNGLIFEFLRGEDDMSNRRAQIKKLERGELDGIIGTTILDVGVDVPAVGFVGLCGGGKAEVSLRQRVGRGLRAKKSGPNIAFFVDYSCNLNNYLRDHQRQRKMIIEKTVGFSEGVLPEGQNLNWSFFDS
jgi:superfamily II DNA or RNA helicase